MTEIHKVEKFIKDNQKISNETKIMLSELIIRLQILDKQSIQEKETYQEAFQREYEEKVMNFFQVDYYDEKLRQEYIRERQKKEN